MSSMLKVKNKETGLVSERWNADASAMVASGHYLWAEEDDLTVRERLGALLVGARRKEFIALAQSVLGTNIHNAETDNYIIDRLVPLVETGKITLPAGLPERRPQRSA